MWKAVRSIAAVIVGFVAASAVMMSIESINGHVLYPELGRMVLGALLTLAGIANNLMLPPPGWFWIPTLLVFIPAALAGARLAPRRAQAGI